MENIIKNILNKSGKKTTVSFKNKEQRKSFDENFGKNKMKIASDFIGDNSLTLAKKLAIK